jgi:hypothetical protein
MPKHTKGPWHLDGMRTVEAKDFTGNYRTVCSPVRGGNPTEADANARLITAAPEMYDALKAYELLDQRHANCPECDGECQPEACELCFPLADDARLKMRLILAKVNGEI